jgi:general secretion pathway protein H
MRAGKGAAFAHPRGFTLLELLVVLAVIGVAAAFVVVTVGGDERRVAEREARRLAGALEHAAARAQWRGETLGISAEGRIYRFWRRDGSGGWLPTDDDDVLAPRALAAGLFVSAATYAGAPVEGNAIVPFRASGRNDPFALALASPAGSFTVSADPLNRVRIVAPGGTPADRPR